jgi:hypothetical protein
LARCQPERPDPRRYIAASRKNPAQRGLQSGQASGWFEVWSFGFMALLAAHL